MRGEREESPDGLQVPREEAPGQGCDRPSQARSPRHDADEVLPDLCEEGVSVFVLRPATAGQRSARLPPRRAGHPLPALRGSRPPRRLSDLAALGETAVAGEAGRMTSLPFQFQKEDQPCKGPGSLSDAEEGPRPSQDR